MSDLQTYRILVERNVIVTEATKVDIEATSEDEAMEIVERLYYDDAIELDEVNRDIGDVYFSEV